MDPVSQQVCWPFSLNVSAALGPCFNLHRFSVRRCHRFRDTNFSPFHYACAATRVQTSSTQVLNLNWRLSEEQASSYRIRSTRFLLDRRARATDDLSNPRRAGFCYRFAFHYVFLLAVTAIKAEHLLMEPYTRGSA